VFSDVSLEERYKFQDTLCLYKGLKAYALTVTSENNNGFSAPSSHNLILLCEALLVNSSINNGAERFTQQQIRVQRNKRV
jgi:hypothetical protein